MKRFLLYSLLVIAGFTAVGASAAAAMIYWASRDLPSYTKVADYRLPLVTTVYARDKSILGYFYEEKRFLVTLDQMPLHLRKAFLAAEDAGFYDHVGIDPKAIARAFIQNTLSGRKKSGGSTITQQIIKRLILTNERSYTRKIKEAILAYRLEKYLSKDEILTIYLNQIYLGSGAHGVEAAARAYFGKHVQDLTLAESSILATLPKAPSTNNPYEDPKATKGRQQYVLNQLLKLKWISQEEYDQAWAQPLAYTSMPDPSWKHGAWYLEEVRRRLKDTFTEKNVRANNIPIDMYGDDAVYRAGLHVYTAMDPEHQAAGEAALRQGLLETTKRQGWRGPIKQMQQAEVANYLESNPFDPVALENAGWTKAVVTKVTAAGADVALGQYKGYINVDTMRWCRTPNIKAAPDGTFVRDATKVLAVGDLVWVSAVGASGTGNPVGSPAKAASPGKKDGVPEYKAAAVKKDASIQLSLEQLPEVEGALVSIETATGDVVALVGGYEYSYHNQFNRAVQAKRQPGSSFKPIVYSAALDKGFTAASMVLDSPFVTTGDASTKEWRPSNYDNTFLGPMLLRTALVKSRNLCTVQIAQRIGMDAIVERAKALGIDGQIPAELAVSLGAHAVSPLTMAEAYSAFANQGRRVKPRVITSVTDMWGQNLVTVEPESEEAISPQNAFVMATLLKEVVNAGTATRARVLGRPVGGKTGTSNEERDTWFIGISPYLTTSVYTGYDQVQSLGRLETGGRTALPSFIYYRKAVDHLYPPDDFEAAPDITSARVDGRTGELAGPSTQQAFVLPFYKGTEPKVVAGKPLEKGQDDAQSGANVFKQMF